MTINTHEIVLNRLSVSYGDTQVLHELSLAVDAGEFVAIVGKSGSGKSTLLYALAGFVKSEGEIKKPDSIGMVFQDYAVYPWLRVSANVAFGLRGDSSADRREIVHRYLDLVGLSDHAQKFPAQLSGGQVQRVALARALAPNPDLLLFDEPFGALDIYTREKMQTWLLNLWQTEHKTALFVTHGIEEAIYLSDRVVVIGAGSIVGQYDVPFSRPRDETIKYSAEFVALKQEIRSLLEGGTKPIDTPALETQL
ncbi:MAG: ABC transporter ATP-binding protein [Planctomycetota bacterium]